jgi:hypothetical protein
MEKTIKFKVWMTVEEMYLDDDGVEQHRDVTDLPRKLGEFRTEQEAYAEMDRLESQVILLPDTPQ